MITYKRAVSILQQIDSSTPYSREDISNVLDFIHTQHNLLKLDQIALRGDCGVSCSQVVRPEPVAYEDDDFPGAMTIEEAAEQDIKDFHRKSKESFLIRAKLAREFDNF